MRTCAFLSALSPPCEDGSINRRLPFATQEASPRQELNPMVPWIGSGQKTQQWPQDKKRSVFIPIPKKGNAKECSNYHTTALISHTSKVMLKILQARLQQYMNQELPDVQAGFRKGRATRDQISNICWIIKKARELQETKQNKTSTSVLLTTPKHLTV